jgi:hypothetical protein
VAFLPGNNANPEGARKHKLWDGALRRAITQEDGARLRQAAEKLLDQAAAGEAWAIKELADRLDGKSPQAIVGDADNPIQLVGRIERIIIENAKASDA